MSHSHIAKKLRYLPLQERQKIKWERSHKVNFYEIDEEFLPEAPQFFSDEEFRQIRKHPEIKNFILDFYRWNKEVLWLVNSTSHPYISMQQTLARQADSHIGEVLVDLGCGTGGFCSQLLQVDGKAIRKIFAIDIDWKALVEVPEALRQANYCGKVALIQGSSMSRLPIWDGSVDSVVSSLGGLMYAGWWFEGGKLVAQKRLALLNCLQDINRVLRPNGCLAFSAPKPEPDWGAILRDSVGWLIKTGRLTELYKAIRYGVPAKKLSAFMNRVERAGYAHYLCVEEWQALLEQTGFEIISSSFGECYAKQGVVIVARKA